MVVTKVSIVKVVHYQKLKNFITQITMYNYGQLCTTFLVLGINECASVTCQHSGTCSDFVNSFACVCGSGYLGYFCDLSTYQDHFLYSLLLLNNSCVEKQVSCV